jgi:hypothetical protein
MEEREKRYSFALSRIPHETKELQIKKLFIRYRDYLRLNETVEGDILELSEIKKIMRHDTTR